MNEFQIRTSSILRVNIRILNYFIKLLQVLLKSKLINTSERRYIDTRIWGSVQAQLKSTSFPPLQLSARTSQRYTNIFCNIRKSFICGIIFAVKGVLSCINSLAIVIKCESSPALLHPCDGFYNLTFLEKVVGSLIWVFQNQRGRFPFHREVPKQTHVNFSPSTHRIPPSFLFHSLQNARTLPKTLARPTSSALFIQQAALSHANRPLAALPCVICVSSCGMVPRSVYSVSTMLANNRSYVNTIEFPIRRLS